METGRILANGNIVETMLPCRLDQFLATQNLPLRSVVVEHNGEAVSPSQFQERQLKDGDRLEIVRIVAGG